MKILKKGDAEKNKWWNGQRIHCCECNCNFELNRGDKEPELLPSKGTDRQPPSGIYYAVECPFCKKRCVFSH